MAGLDVFVAHVFVVELPLEIGLNDVETRLHGPNFWMQPHCRARLGLVGVQRLHPCVPHHTARLWGVPLEDVPSVDHNLERVRDGCDG